MLRALLDPRRWLAPVTLDRGPTLLLLGAAVAVAVGGYEHAHLYHQGYSEIATIGTLFLLNAIGSLLTILLLLARRPLAFVAGSLAISVGSIVAIVLTRSSSGLFGFRESGYDGHALVTVGAEAVAVVLTLAGAAWAGRALLAGGTAEAAARPSDGETSARTVFAVAVTVVLGGATIGIAQGGGGEQPPAPIAEQPATTAPEEATDAEGSAPEDGGAAVSGPAVERSRALFADRCSGCHRLSDAGASGRIGPDLDAVLPSETAAKIRESIVDPDAEATPGFSTGRMPSFAD
jgi:mono/diheme cytochrome c family protein